MIDGDGRDGHGVPMQAINNAIRKAQVASLSEVLIYHLGSGERDGWLNLN